MGFVGFPNFPFLEAGRDSFAPIPPECHGRSLALFSWIGQLRLSPAHCGLPTNRPGSFAMSSSTGLRVPGRCEHSTHAARVHSGTKPHALGTALCRAVARSLAS